MQNAFVTVGVGIQTVGRKCDNTCKECRPDDILEGLVGAERLLQGGENRVAESEQQAGHEDRIKLPIKHDFQVACDPVALASACGVGAEYMRSKCGESAVLSETHPKGRLVAAGLQQGRGLCPGRGCKHPKMGTVLAVMLPSSIATRDHHMFFTQGIRLQ
jgi:hypothetical protein